MSTNNDTAAVLDLARQVEAAWRTADQPAGDEPTSSSVEIARRVMDLPAGPLPSETIDHLLADIADFVHLDLDHPISGVCHGDNDGCEGGPSPAACEAADDVLDFLNLDEDPDTKDPYRA